MNICYTKHMAWPPIRKLSRWGYATPTGLVVRPLEPCRTQVTPIRVLTKSHELWPVSLAPIRGASRILSVVTRSLVALAFEALTRITNVYVLRLSSIGADPLRMSAASKNHSVFLYVFSE